jgi:hypothetical protein
MKHLKITSIFWVAFLLLLLAGCSSQGGAAQAVEGYIQALADKDQDSLVNLSCNDWQENALLELDSLVGVTAETQDLTCQESGTDGADTLVTCSGKLVLNYNGELQDLDLSGRTMIARQEDGEWRACGYK